MGCQLFQFDEKDGYLSDIQWIIPNMMNWDGNPFNVIPWLYRCSGVISMNAVDTGERIANEISKAVQDRLVSALVYGSDIGKEGALALDCNLVLVFDRIDLQLLEAVKVVLNTCDLPCMKVPLMVQTDEIEGMMDSVPSSFLDILLSYQTVHGRSLFKGLSSINHEHLRAQTEQRLRENLFSARRSLLHGMRGRGEMENQFRSIRELFRRSIQIYSILKKPWLTNEEERWSSFQEEFDPDGTDIRKTFDIDLSGLSDDELKRLTLTILDRGFKPLLCKVDEMGPCGQ